MIGFSHTDGTLQRFGIHKIGWSRPVREAVDPAVVAASRMAGVAMTAIVVGGNWGEPVGRCLWIGACWKFGITNVSDSTDVV